MTKRNVLIFLFLLVSHAALFIAGGVTARKIAVADFFAQSERADTDVMIGHYSGYRDISLKIKEGNYGSAQCLADLSASAMLDGLRRCSTSKTCASLLKARTKQDFPEIFGNQSPPFHYIESVAGRKICPPQNNRKQ